MPLVAAAAYLRSIQLADEPPRHATTPLSVEGKDNFDTDTKQSDGTEIVEPVAMVAPVATVVAPNIPAAAAPEASTAPNASVAHEAVLSLDGGGKQTTLREDTAPEAFTALNASVAHETVSAPVGDGKETTLREEVAPDEARVFKAAAEMLLAAGSLDKDSSSDRQAQGNEASGMAMVSKDAQGAQESQARTSTTLEVAAAGAAGAARARALASHADPNVHETNEAAALSPTSLVARAFEGAIEVRPPRVPLSPPRDCEPLFRYFFPPSLPPSFLEQAGRG